MMDSTCEIKLITSFSSCENIIFVMASAFIDDISSSVLGTSFFGLGD